MWDNRIQTLDAHGEEELNRVRRRIEAIKEVESIVTFVDMGGEGNHNRGNKRLEARGSIGGAVANGENGVASFIGS